MRGWPRKVTTGLAVALCAGGMAGLALPAAAGEDQGSIHPTLSGDDAEARETVPVSSHPGAEPRVALSTPISSPSALRRGDLIRVSAELQVTTTCVDEKQRCIGRPYDFSPRITARLLLARGRTTTQGRKLSRQHELECNQRRPNRNHHCVFVFAGIEEQVRNSRRLPCPAERCFVNVVVTASHPQARPNNLIVLGYDRPDGSVGTDKARLDLLVERGTVNGPKVVESTTEARAAVPIEPGGGQGRRVLYSVRLDGLRRGDVLLARARQLMSIAGLPYNVFVGTRLVMAKDPGDTRPRGIARRAAALGGEVSELNGFNCTHGASAYRDPCQTRKAAMTRIRHTPMRAGKPAPLYLNLVGAGLEKLANAGAGDRMRVLDGGYLRVARYREPD